jgi:hypothetical protein
MLDTLKLNHYLNLASCEELFQKHQTILHTTSLLRFPVFVDNKNYSGAQPHLLSNSFLRTYALSSLREELSILPHALIVPLGRTVEGMLELLMSAGELDKQRCLWGFPHPSGANGHKYKQFSSHQEQMEKTLGNHLWKG